MTLNVKNIAILGSTGSIGTQALGIVRRNPNRFNITALAVHSNIDLLQEQISQFKPNIVAVYDKEKAAELERRGVGVPVLAGAEGIDTIAAEEQTELVLAAIAGTRGLAPTLAAIEAGKNVALANKEALVSGGELVTRRVREKGVQLLPVDSEHSALFQCLQGEDPNSISRLILTASGGPFREIPQGDLQKINVSAALRHPNWSMGPKVTIDSSTLMNKGLEVIEAHWLFNVPLDKIDVVIHPEQLIHSMVEFVDGSTKAQLSEPTMEVPIQYALTYPERIRGTLAPLDFTKYRSLHFSPPDTDRFRCLALAYQAQREGRSYPSFLNAANEVLVHRFIQEEIDWMSIGRYLEKLLNSHKAFPVDAYEAIMQADNEGRYAAQHIKG